MTMPFFEKTKLNDGAVRGALISFPFVIFLWVVIYFTIKAVVKLLL